ncbi:hypothetical protein [Aurantiacibacter aquimixticola]|uniref:META domain-containing protein n=1 Tax=Aurantiacibacter aquimixticola TaxID=1958945 RepID=A0A419RW14_9SPHN|nr:hypothetical protein [Aurantiacibacter aquimixticola]RJY09982.1 hypothetical protein D6201_12040 [Aurantiacibacter aquimixticola]
MAAIFGVTGTRLLDWRAWFDGPERGTWRAKTLDGVDVRERRMWVVIEDGEIVAGRDGCNYWGWETEPDPATGERGIISTLAACGPEPGDEAYGALSFGTPEMQLRPADHLVLRAMGHEGIFIRWTDEMEEAEHAADEREMERQRALQPKVRSPVYPAAPPGPPTARPPPPPPAPAASPPPAD